MSRYAVTIALIALVLPAAVQAQSNAPRTPGNVVDGNASAERRDLVDPRTGQPREGQQDDSDRQRSPYGTPYRITMPWQDNPLRTPWGH